MSLFEELKRRKVFKVGAAYAVVGWLVIQVAATLAPQLGLPDWSPRLITLIVLLGFPLAIVLAWLLDYSSEGIKFEAAGFGHKRVFTVAAILAALALGWFLRGGVPTGGGAASEAALGEKSTAVLPFVNMSADKDNEYFSDGLTENLLHKLAQVAELKVAARTSSFAFKGKQEDIRGIGKALGVATVVEGSVQRAGDTLRITAQLVRTHDGSHIWSQRYDRKLADLFAIQDEIANAVAEALVGALVPEAKAAIASGGTQNMAAYDDYTRGLQQLAHFNFDSLTRAETLFQKALATDPGYLDAMTALARTYERMNYTGMISNTELEARAAPWLDRIEALDPGNGMLLTFRALGAAKRSDLGNALRLYQRAVAAAPNSPEAALAYAQYLRSTGDDRAALEQIERALRLDPANSLVHITRGRLMLSMNRRSEAQDSGRKAIELDPEQPNSYGLLAEIAVADGDPAGEVVARMGAHRVDPRDHEVASELAVELALLGEFEAADAWLAEARRVAPGNSLVEAREVDVLWVRGDYEATIAKGLAFGPRAGQNLRDAWFAALGDACYAAVKLGRTAEVRARLVEFGAIPRELTPAAFRALDARNFPLTNRVALFVPYLAPCAFEDGEAGARQRREMLATMDDVFGPNWRQQRDQRFNKAFLEGDKDALVKAMLPREGRNDVGGMPWNELLARFAGIADDPRWQGYVADSRKRIAKSKAELRERLKKEGLDLMPAKAG